MLEAGGDLDLTREATGPDGDRNLGSEYLEGHLAVVLQILSEVDRRHPALPQLALDQVAVCKGALQPCKRVGHCDGPVLGVGLGYGTRRTAARPAGRAREGPVLVGDSGVTTVVTQGHERP